MHYTIVFGPLLVQLKMKIQHEEDPPYPRTYDELLHCHSFKCNFASKVNLSKSSFHGVRIAQVCPFHARTTHSMTTTHSSSSMVVKMAKREEELKEIRAKTTEELPEEIVDLKGELFMLRLQRSARNEFKSSEFLRKRKRIARMLTVKREREMEEGINKRISRKLDRRWKKSIVPRPPPSLKKLREEEATEEAKENA